MEKMKIAEQLKDFPCKFQRLSPLVSKTTIRFKGGYGTVYELNPYLGVQLKYVDFDVKGMEFSAIEKKDILTLNFCFSGRYEMFVPEDKYIYVSDGVLNIDITPPLGRVIYTVGSYSGIEFTMDLGKAASDFPKAWLECGIDFTDIIKLSRGANGSCLVKTTAKWNFLAKELADHMVKADDSLEVYRFLTLQFLWMLLLGGSWDVIVKPMFLTLGQRAVAFRTQERITADLSERQVITRLAQVEGVSPSSLKKYFTQVYGKSISAYLREMRVEKAKELLEAGSQGVAGIANEVGYENQSKFGVMFKRETGLTPIEYKRLHGKGSFLV